MKQVHLLPRNRRSATLAFSFLDRLFDLVAKASVSRAEDPGFESRLRLPGVLGSASGVLGSALGLVGPVSVYGDWVR